LLSRANGRGTPRNAGAARHKALPYQAGLDAATRAGTMDRFLNEDGVVIVATIALAWA